VGTHISRGIRISLAVGALAGVMFAAVAATPTLASKGSRTTTSTSTISLNTAAPHLGGTVTFTTAAYGLAGSEWPMVGISCTQAGELVYGALDAPGATFLLGGNWSLWLERGGSASCHAWLYAYGTRGGQETIRSLAVISFTAAGS
jgi:hypothetical protein